MLIPSILEVPCPTCKKKTPWQGNDYRPFCSDRCKQIDLGSWAEGTYRIDRTPSDESDPSQSDEDLE